MRSAIEAGLIFLIQTVIWWQMPLSPGLTKFEITVCYLTLFCIAFAILAIAESLWEGITGKELPD